MVYTRGITPPRTLIPSHATSGVIPPSYLDTLPRHARYNSASHLDTLPHHAHTTIPRSRDVKSSHGEHCRTDEPYLCAGRGAATATPAWTAGLNSIRRANRPPASWLLASARLPSEFPMSGHLRDSAVTSRCSFSCRFKIALLISKNLMHLASCLPYLHYINIDFFPNSSIMKRSGYIASLLISKTKIMYLAICILFELIILQYVIISSVIFGLKTYHII
jgi:hypothetical protein